MLFTLQCWAGNTKPSQSFALHYQMHTLELCVAFKTIFEDVKTCSRHFCFPLNSNRIQVFLSDVPWCLYLFLYCLTYLFIFLFIQMVHEYNPAIVMYAVGRISKHFYLFICISLIVLIISLHLSSGLLFFS